MLTMLFFLYLLKNVILENMTESKKDEMEDVNNIENVDYTRDITKSQITEHLVPGNFLRFSSIMLRANLKSLFVHLKMKRPIRILYL